MNIITDQEIEIAVRDRFAELRRLRKTIKDVDAAALEMASLIISDAKRAKDDPLLKLALQFISEVNRRARESVALDPPDNHTR